MSHWEEWLAFLRKLPADAPEWSGADAFLADAKAILDSRRLEAESLGQLASALTRLKQGAQAHLDWWGFTGVQLWEARSGLAASRSLLEGLDAFHDALSTHATLINRLHANAREFETHLDETRRSAQRIRELHDTLSLALAAESQFSPQTSAPMGEGSAPGSAALHAAANEPLPPTASSAPASSPGPLATPGASDTPAAPPDNTHAPPSAPRSLGPSVDAPAKARTRHGNAEADEDVIPTIDFLGPPKQVPTVVARNPSLVVGRGSLQAPRKTQIAVAKKAQSSQPGQPKDAQIDQPPAEPIPPTGVPLPIPPLPSASSPTLPPTAAPAPEGTAETDATSDVPSADATPANPNESGLNTEAAPARLHDAAEGKSSGIGSTPESAPVIPIARELAPAVEADKSRPSLDVPKTSIPQNVRLRSATQPVELPLERAERIPGMDLLSARSVLADMRATDSKAAWSQVLWPMLAEGDVGGAYWLQRWIDGDGSGSPSTLAKLLMALAGSETIARPDSPIATDLLGLTQETHLAANGSFEELIVLAAALYPAALAPVSGMASWLIVPALCQESARPLLEALQSFATLEITVDPADLLAIKGEERRAAERRRLQADVRHWLSDAQARRTTLKRANVVWLTLARPGGELHTLLELVSQDDRRLDKQVGETADNWRSQSYVDQRIRKIDAEKAGASKRPIEAAALIYIRKNIAEACALVERWRALNKVEAEIERRGTWLIDKVRAARGAIEAATPALDLRLNDLMRKSEPPLAAAAAALKRSVGRLKRFFSLDADGVGPEYRAATAYDSGDNLEEVLARRLLYWPEVDLDDGGKPITAALRALPEALLGEAAAESRLARAQRAMIEREDYRRDEQLSRLASAGGQELDLEARARARENSHLRLKGLVEQCHAQIEQAVVDGLISQDDERSEYAAIADSVRIEKTQNYGAATALLKSRILDALKNRRAEKTRDLRRDWDQILARLPLSEIARTRQERLTNTIEAAFTSGGLRAIEELLSHVREALDRQSDLDEGLFSPGDSLENDYVQARDSYYSKLRDYDNITGLVSRQVAIASNQLSRTLAEEARHAADAWRRLKDMGRAQNDDALKETVRALLRFLNLSEDGEDRQPVRVMNASGRSTDGFAHLRASVEAGSTESRFFPQFGSQARGKHDIVCVWDRASAPQLEQYLRELRLETQSVIVIYLARMRLAQRHRVSRQAKSGDVAVLVLDETLFAFLLADPRPRWQVFLRCAAPFSAINPYTPYRAGDVPPEMYFGRDDESRSLQSESGSCLVYGGRQLGKSALLRRTERQFNHPERHHYAWVVDIKRYGDLSQPADLIWREIIALLDATKLKGQKSPATITPENALAYVKTLFSANTELRVLIMLDESDNFVEADARQRFSNIEIFRQLMSETERRFKVVLAGLKTVQRFQSLPNQPLAHFGSPIRIGPLAPRAAQALVRQPFEALGYAFADDAIILTILSYTNYHAGLVQLFCHELLKVLHQRKPDDGAPPFAITAADVERVFRNQETRDSILQRFDWTLALDERYQAIAWSMVSDQSGAADSSAHAYDPSEIRNLVHENWPAGFATLDADAFRGVLNEMEGLGVLARSNTAYRLRSPNVARLMGHVEDRLEALRHKRPSPSFTADSYHTPLDSKTYSRYSPVTYEQEREIGRETRGTGVIIASDLNGLSSIPMAIERVILPSGAAPRAALIRHGPSESDMFLEPARTLAWLRVQRSSHKGLARRIYLLEPDALSPALAFEIARRSMEFCAETESDRVFIALAPEPATAWMAIPVEDRLALADQLVISLTPRRWDTRGIRQRLAQLEKPDSDAVCDALMAATSGWHWLVERAFDMPELKKIDGAGKAAAALTQRLKDESTAERKGFVNALGLAKGSAALRVLDTARQYGHLTSADILDTMDDGPPLSAEEALAARELLVTLGYLEIDERGVLRVEPLVAQCLA